MSKGKALKRVKLKTGKKSTHGGYSFLTTGRLPEHRREVERYLTMVREGLIRDIAGEEGDLTAAQLILLDRVISKVGLLRCMEEHVREAGIFKGQELAPALKKSYISYSNSLRLDLQALGIDKRKADEGFDLGAYIREHDAEKAAEKASELSQESDSGQGEGENG